MGNIYQLSVFDTVQMSDKQFEQKTKESVNMEQEIIKILTDAGTHMTAWEVLALYQKKFGPALITSIRRSLTRQSYKDNPALEKVYVSKMGKYGVPNWQYQIRKENSNSI